MIDTAFTPTELVAHIVSEGVLGEMFGIDYAARVALGVAHLDEQSASWWEMERVNPIDLGILNIGDGTCCVTAQLSGENDFVRGCSLYNVSASNYSGTARGMDIEYGFSAETEEWSDMPEGYDMVDAYDTLTRLWVNVIRVRRGLPVEV